MASWQDAEEFNQPRQVGRAYDVPAAGAVQLDRCFRGVGNAYRYQGEVSTLRRSYFVPPALEGFEVKAVLAAIRNLGLATTSPRFNMITPEFSPRLMTHPLLLAKVSRVTKSQRGL